MDKVLYSRPMRFNDMDNEFMKGAMAMLNMLRYDTRNGFTATANNLKNLKVDEKRVRHFAPENEPKEDKKPASLSSKGRVSAKGIKK